MRATRKAIVTDARKELLSNGYAVWGKSRMHATYIPDARNPFNRPEGDHRKIRNDLRPSVTLGSSPELSASKV